MLFAKPHHTELGLHLHHTSGQHHVAYETSRAEKIMALQIPCRLSVLLSTFRGPGCVSDFCRWQKKKANRIQEQVGGQGGSEGPFYRRADTEGFLGCPVNKSGALRGLEKNSVCLFVSLVNTSNSKLTWKENSLEKQGKEATMVSLKCTIDAFQLFPLCSLVLEPSLVKPSIKGCLWSAHLAPGTGLTEMTAEYKRHMAHGSAQPLQSVRYHRKDLLKRIYEKQRFNSNCNRNDSRESNTSRF